MTTKPHHVLAIVATMLLGLSCDDGESSDTDISSPDSTVADGTSSPDGAAPDATSADGVADQVAGDPVTISFAAQLGTEPYDCTTVFTGLGTSAVSATLSELRFYASDIHLIDDTGTAVPVTLDQDGVWQSQNVALLDFEDGSGTCANGTADTNLTVNGTVPTGTYTGIEFTIGVPFELNHGDLTMASAPLNLGSMHWHWQGGYKFLRADFFLDDADGGTPWNVHLGSTMCDSAAAPIAPTEACGRPNRPTVRFDAFDPTTQTIVFDVAALVASSDLAANTMDTPPGCQAVPPDVNECGGVFGALGLDYMTGECATDCSDQSVFRVE